MKTIPLPVIAGGIALAGAVAAGALGFAAGGAVNEATSPPDVIVEPGGVYAPEDTGGDGMWGDIIDMLPMIMMLMMALK